MFSHDDDQDEHVSGTKNVSRPENARSREFPPQEEIRQAIDEQSRLWDDLDGYKANHDAWLRRWSAAGYQYPQQIFQQQQQQMQQQQQQAAQLKSGSAVSQPSDTLLIEFAPDFTPEEVQRIAASLADYFRACGGAGFDYEFESQEAPMEKR